MTNNIERLLNVGKYFVAAQYARTMSEPDCLNAFADIIKAQIMNDKMENAKKTLKLFPEQIFQKKILAMLEKSVNNGWLNESKKLAELTGRQLTAKEVSIICKNRIGTGPIDEAIETAGLLNKPKRISELSSILSKSIEKGDVGYAIQTVNLLNRNFTDQELSLLYDTCFAKVSWPRRKWPFIVQILELTPEPSRAERATAVLKTCLENGYLYYAQRMAGLLNRVLSVDELLIILEKCVRKHNIADTEVIIKLLPESTNLTKFTAILDEECVKPGFLDGAQMMARLFNYSLTESHFSTALENCLSGGHIEEAKKTVRLLNREFTDTERTRIFVAYVEQDKLDEAEAIAKTLATIKAL